jgi:DNA helicase-2/ATP-dependent DNA helicase PcrA
VLGDNFRSRAEILHAAVACASHNAERTGKELLAVRGAGGQLEVQGFGDEQGEAAWVTRLIADALAAGVPPAEMLVLARTGYALGPIQHALAAAGIPHRVLGNLGLYERAEVRDAIAYLALLADPADAQAFRRAVQAPRRGIGPAACDHVVSAARARHGGDLIAASARAQELTAIRSQPARDRLARFGSELERIQAETRPGAARSRTSSSPP